MYVWHRIAPDGSILDTKRAPDKASADRILAGAGPVVSALSWRLDVHRFRPVRTVMTETQQRQAPKIVRYPAGIMGTGAVVRALGITERRLRTLLERHRIEPQRMPYGARIVKGYTAAQVERLRALL